MAAKKKSGTKKKGSRRRAAPRKRPWQNVVPVAMPAGAQTPVEAFVEANGDMNGSYIPIRKVGQPTKYHPDMVKMAAQYIDFGLTENQIAQLFEVSVMTMWHWKRRYPQFAKALELTPERRNKIVEASLYLKATGYSHPAIRILPPAVAGGDPVVVEYTEYYPPDTSSIALWLLNRAPGRYKRRGTAPADDIPAPGQAAEREKARYEQFAALGRLVEENARRGGTPVFARDAPTRISQPAVIDLPSREGALGASAQGPKKKG